MERRISGDFSLGLQSICAAGGARYRFVFPVVLVLASIEITRLLHLSCMYHMFL